MTIRKNLGHTPADTQVSRAEIAAAGRFVLEFQVIDADGGPIRNLGHLPTDAQPPCAEMAAAGQRLLDAQKTDARGGTS